MLVVSNYGNLILSPVFKIAKTDATVSYPETSRFVDCPVQRLFSRIGRERLFLARTGGEALSILQSTQKLEHADYE